MSESPTECTCCVDRGDPWTELFVSVKLSEPRLSALRVSVSDNSSQTDLVLSADACPAQGGSVAVEWLDSASLSVAQQCNASGPSAEYWAHPDGSLAALTQHSVDAVSYTLSVRDSQLAGNGVTQLTQWCVGYRGGQCWLNTEHELSVLPSSYPPLCLCAATGIAATWPRTTWCTPWTSAWAAQA